MGKLFLKRVDASVGDSFAHALYSEGLTTPTKATTISKVNYEQQDISAKIKNVYLLSHLLFCCQSNE